MNSLPKIIFIDKDKNFKKYIDREIKCDIKYLAVVGDIKDYLLNNTAYISPTNSLGSMDDEIDKEYSNYMFSDAKEHVKKAIDRIGKTSRYGRKYLPVGSGMIIPVTSSKTDVKNTYLVHTPTMYIPQDVSETNNAYYSFLTALILTTNANKKGNNIKYLVCPPLCSGYGKMSFKNGASQINEALENFISNRKKYLKKDIGFYLIVEPNKEEQPDLYINEEFM